MSEDLRQLLWILAISLPIGLLLGFILRYWFKRSTARTKQATRRVPWWCYVLCGLMFSAMAAGMWFGDYNLPFSVFFLVFALLEFGAAVMVYSRSKTDAGSAAKIGLSDDWNYYGP
ncbi:MAG: hypothetical protein WDZ31_01465 [Phycisphaeraceae bacterium]